jgi:riboflavin kinase / FMN adenylyltransferase
MIYRSIGELPADFGPSVVTVGNFDGVHVGHRRIMRQVVDLSKAHGWMPAVLTFDPHPARLVAPDRAPKLITTPEERARLMEREGIETVVILPFTSEVARLEPEDFVKSILVDRLRARAVVVGENFRFGHFAAGDTTMLRGLGVKYGFNVETTVTVRWRRWTVSSTEIRRRIETGDVGHACRMLGRPFAVEGPVVHGHGVGSKQTVPTLNLEPGGETLPARGVYITRTRETGGSRHWPSITNLGVRPTFGGDKLAIETFLLAPLDGPTPAGIRVEFLRRVREERKFESPEALKAQILRDVSRAKAYFRRVETFGCSPTTG